MSRKRRRESKGSGSPAWMTTFSDLMTLLLTFFILLYSFSNLDVVKFQNIAKALQSALTGQGAITIFENDSPPGDTPLEEMNPSPDHLSESLSRETKEIYEKVYNFIENEGLEAEVTLRADHRGVIIDIKDTILFDSGEATLKTTSKNILEKVTKLINEFKNNIIIEGHTDNVPMHNRQFPSNWELSAIRATTVVRYFAEERGINPKRLSVGGYGEYNPIAPNDSDENRSLNRRVNILIVTAQEGED